MRIASKPVLLTVPVVMFIALVAVLALWSNGSLSGNGIGGATTSASMTWNVEYWHRNAAGDLIEYKKEHNAFLKNGKEIAMERLIKVGAGHLQDTSTATGLIQTDAFNKIVLQVTDNDSDSSPNAIETGLISLTVDGDNGTSGSQNPATGSFSDGGGDGTGDGSIAVTFVADDTSVLSEMSLVAAPPDDTDNGSVEIAIADVLAVISLSVTLESTDTPTVTWTIDAS